MKCVAVLKKANAINTMNIPAEIKLDPRSCREVTLGRDPRANTYCLDSSKTKFMISRKHAQLTYEEYTATWMLIDLKSTNGIHVNGRKVDALKPTVLKDRDMITFGVAAPDSEFSYEVQLERSFSKGEAGKVAELRELRLRAETREKERELEELRRLREETKVKERELEELKRKEEQRAKEEEKWGAKIADLEKTCEHLREKEKETKKKSAGMKRRFEEMQKQKDAENEAVRKKLKKLEDEKNKEKQRINLELSQLREKQQQKEQEMEEQKRIAVEMKSKLEQQNRLNEERIQREKQEAKERLLQLQQDNRAKEKACRDLEVKLRATLEKTKADKEQQEMLKKSLDDLSKKREMEQEEYAIKMRNMEEEKKMNETRSKEKKKELDRYAAEIKKLNEKVEASTKEKEKFEKAQQELNDLGERLEDDIACAICCNHFIDPRTLSCSHTFCEFCIRGHLSTKDDCPHCRHKVDVPIKSLVLAAVVEKFVSRLSAEERQLYEAEREERRKKNERVSRALQRLQREIDKASSDENIFLCVRNKWEEEDKDTFCRGIDMFDHPAPRELYAHQVGLSKKDIAKMDKRTLKVALENLRLKPASKEDLGLSDIVLEMRRRLSLFVSYGTKILRKLKTSQ